MKEFLQPTTSKMVLVAGMLLLTVFIPKYDDLCSPEPSGLVCTKEQIKGIGFPVFLGETFSGDAILTGFYPKNFLINLIGAYLIASTTMTAFARKLARQRFRIVTR